MLENLSQRKNIRLKNYDYSDVGYYFVTICTKDRKQILSEINQENVGVVAHGDPQNKLKYVGEVAKQYIDNIENVYKNIKTDEYMIMPNHIHIIIIIDSKNGSPWATTPTIPMIISSLKTLINKRIGYQIFQRNYYEHIIRDEKEYYIIKEYVKNNVINWIEDKYY